MLKKFLKLLSVMFAIALLLPAVSVTPDANAMVIGYYDSPREQYGFTSYISNAGDYLVAQGHTLVGTQEVSDTFLAGVDAFYTGLITTISADEVSAMQAFVDNQGGFLFIQTDWADASWTGACNTILANWGIAVAGHYVNDDGHYTVGASDWVTQPNDVDTFIGSAHSVITSSLSGFEVLGRDDLDRPVLGVYDAGAGRSSDVLIATDINFWDNTHGWSNTNNRLLWENIWQSASSQIEVPEPCTMLLLGFGLLGLGLARRKS